MSFATDPTTGRKTATARTSAFLHELLATISRLVQRATLNALDFADAFRPQSLRQRLILWSSGLVVILFATLSLVVYLAQARILQDNAQQTLNREVYVVQTTIAHEVLGNPPLWPEEIRIGGITPVADPGLIIEIHDVSGNHQWTTDPNGNTNLLGITAAQDQLALSGTPFALVTYVQSGRMLIEVTPLYNLQNQIIGVAHIARSLQAEDASLGNLRFLLIIANSIALVSAVVGGWYLTRRALSPLSQIARVANGITQALAGESNRTSEALRLRVPTVHDSGELGALVADVNRMLDALARYDERQRQFITDASHELRSPLTTIRGNLELVRRLPHLTATERDEALGDASAEADRMTLLINDLLTLARAESSGNVPKPHVPVEIDAILVEVFRLARERVLAQNMTDLEVKLQDVQPARVLGDPLQLRQLLLILVDNALKYAPCGALTLGMAVQANHVRLTVSDTGPGISREDLPHIFDRFYRANRERDRDGSGLGLAIARTLVDQHNGTISVTSQIDQGTTFTIVFPQIIDSWTVAAEKPDAGQ